MSKDLIEKLEKINQLEEQFSKDELRRMISKLESEMLKGPQIELKITHHFSKGTYAREMFAPKGALIVGKIHKHQCLNIVSKGKIAVTSIDGTKIISAPCTFVSSPGVKRVGFAIEDTIWTTIHGTDETDLEKIESQFIAKNYDELLEHEAQKSLEIKEDKCLG